MHGRKDDYRINWIFDIGLACGLLMIAMSIYWWVTT